ncbi:dihydropteroate synthase [Planctomycetota bacterium]
MLRATARLHRVRLVESITRPGEVLVIGPVLLLRELAKDLPPASGRSLHAGLKVLAGHRRRLVLRHGRGELDVTERTAIMGILNVTPDSFSDGGCYFEKEVAIDRGLRLREEGADLVDVGGESTRPGAERVPLAEELRRTLPVVQALAERDILVSIDTSKPEVARRALEAGAAVVNDISGLREPAMCEVVTSRRAGVVIMHMQGDPQTMQQKPQYENVVLDVTSYLAERASAAARAGIPKEAIALDPGIGFGKTLEHNLALIRGVNAIAGLGYPVLVGLSRKSFLGALTGGKEPRERVAAGLAALAVAVERGARVVRTHDVAETADALKVRAALVDTPSRVR